jgi:hypothetical protein
MQKNNKTCFDFKSYNAYEAEIAVKNAIPNARDQKKHRQYPQHFKYMKLLIIIAHRGSHSENKESLLKYKVYDWLV